MKRGKKHRREREQPVDAVSALTDGKSGFSNNAAMAVLAIGFAFGLGVIYEWEPLNGLSSLTHWEWPWQDLGMFQMGLALLAPFLVIAWALWSIENDVSRLRAWLLAGILAAANFAGEILSVAADPRGLQRIKQIVASPDATSYFTDAMSIHGLTEWMSHFHQAALHGHASTHPAGPILFYYAFLKLFGPDAGASFGGYALGFAGSAGVLVMYLFAGLWTSDRRVRVLASAFYALVPALTVFFPELDQVYPIFSMLLILTWARGLGGSRANSIFLGVVLFVASLFAYNLLATGAFLLYYGLYWLWRRGGTRAAWMIAFRTAGAALAVCTGLYLALWAAIGYNAPASLGHAIANQTRIGAALNRPYFTFVVLDLYDYFLGAGIIAAPILFLYLRRMLKGFTADRTDGALTLLGLATILTVDVSGLLRGETSRVWLFLQPLLIVPVAIELSRLRRPWRLAIFAMQWWIVVSIKAKMSFIEP